MILGVESSCDETALALLKEGQYIVAEAVSSQIPHHLPYGGVVPELASRKHLEVLSELFAQIMQQASATEGSPDAILDAVQGIAVSGGPGLLGSLLVGIEYAKGLALALKKPLIYVDHVLAHIHGAFLSLFAQNQTPVFPSLGFVISGGHTHLFRIEDYTRFHLMAQTVDDACGECFDKVGKMLGLPYPGGPHLEKLARKGDPHRYPMPRMMSRSRSLDLSYSGLKTYVWNFSRKFTEEQRSQESWRADVAASFQHEAFDQLIRKLQLAWRQNPNFGAIYICGGVACNEKLRQMMLSWAEERGITLKFAYGRWCTDNAAMIASLGYRKLLDHPAGDGWLWQPYSRFQSTSSSS